MTPIKTSLAAGVAALALVSTGAWGALVFSEEPFRDASATAGASSPARAAGSEELTQAERGRIFSNRDGTISRAQYMRAMERRWDNLAKNRSGDVPAEAARVVKHKDAPSSLSVPNY